MSVIAMIIDSVIAVITLLTLIVAVMANKQNKEEIGELRNATIQSLKMHEQSKNIQLIDLRIQILDEIENIKLPNYSIGYPPEKVQGIKSDISINKLRMLYNQDADIIKTFKKLDKCYEEVDCLINDIFYFYQLTLESDGEGGYYSPIWETICKYEIQLDFDSDDDSFRKYCEENIYIDRNPETNQVDEYNYYDISKKIGRARCMFEDDKQKLITQMRVFIEESISPLLNV